jgi:hypothetical protein
MTPTYKGQPANLGRVVVGQAFPGEGYAVIRCGGTEVQVSYTLLHAMHLDIDPHSYHWSHLCDLSRALDSIKCEASIGRTGDEVQGAGSPNVATPDGQTKKSTNA